jgi:hypothetical protein
LSSAIVAHGSSSRTDVTPRTRKAIAVFCIAIVLVAGVLPAIPTALADAIFVALWIVLPAVIVTIVRRAALDSDEQPVSLLALLDSRGPPRLPASL